MDSYPTLSQAELNATALDHFVYQPVDKQMIRYLAKAAAEVIQCDPNMMPPPAANKRYPSPPRTPSPRAVKSSDGVLPSIEDFITQLVVSSNVQVPTLMSTLVYLNRLKSRLQPMAKGLRCTTHRIFLASLILAAKYLNDSSPKNKHWANYSVVSTQAYHFGFNRTEVNLMEKQLLFLLDWDLRITEEDLYANLDPFLAPVRTELEARHARRMRRHAEKERERQLADARLAHQHQLEEEARVWSALAAHQQQPQTDATTTCSVSIDNAYATPPSSSRGTSRSRNLTSHSRGSSRDVSPPGLYSSASSYAGSVSEVSSRATTPCSEADLGTAEIDQTYIYDEAMQEVGMCDSPMQVVLDQAPAVPAKDGVYGGGKRQQQQQQQMLPYEISAEELRGLEERARGAHQGKKSTKGVWGRVWGAVGAAR